MFKQKLTLEVKGSEDRVFKFECDPQAPLGEIHDALQKMKGYVVQLIHDYDKKESPAKEECKDECTKECKTVKEKV